MQEVQVKEVARREKGRVFFRFDNGTEFTLYRSEIRGLPAGGEHAFDDGGCVSAGITI